MKKLLFFAIFLFSIAALAAPITLLSPTADAGNSTSFTVSRDAGIRGATVIMYSAVGLVAAEYGDIQISHDGGTTWQDLYVNGSQVRMDSTNNAVTVYGAGIYRVAKEATTNAAGIYLSTKDDL